MVVSLWASNRDRTLKGFGSAILSMRDSSPKGRIMSSEKQRTSTREESVAAGISSRRFLSNHICTASESGWLVRSCTIGTVEVTHAVSVRPFAYRGHKLYANIPSAEKADDGHELSGDVGVFQKTCRVLYVENHPRNAAILRFSVCSMSL